MTDSIQVSTAMSLSTYTATDSAGTIAFAAKLPGSILGVDVGPEQEYLVDRHGFLAATPGITVSAGFRQPFATGIFADEGLVLRRVSGPGAVWLQSAPMPVLAASLAPYLR
jgi:uncharacterized protein (AIM24 family)